MHIIYRLCEGVGNKPRPEWFSKQKCLANFLRIFDNSANTIHFVLDGFSREGMSWVQNITEEFRGHTDIAPVRYINEGRGGPAFLHALEEAEDLKDGDFVYFVEDDYLHRDGAAEVLADGLQRFGYVSLYDHPDKYANPSPNNLVKHGSHPTRVHLGRFCHWKIVDSTTMTFATRVDTLRYDMEIFREHSQGSVPSDNLIFRRITDDGGVSCLATPLPAYATHCESVWLAPHVDWSRI